jgi:RsiW-degrading membrane proteinase PrsW (M82 family)
MPQLDVVVPAAALALVPAIAYLLLLNAVDRYEKEPWTLVLAAVGLGAVVAPIVSMAVLGALGHRQTLPGELATTGDPLPAIVEQVVKGALLLALVHVIRDEFDDVIDGIVYGAALGVGFAATQSLLFWMGPSRLDLPTTATVLVAGLNQAFYGAVVGAIVAIASTLRSPRRYWLVVLLGIATAALLDAFHDSLPLILARIAQRPDPLVGSVTKAIGIAVNGLGLLTLLIAVVLGWRRERRILLAELRSEVEAGLIPLRDLDAITSPRRHLAMQRITLGRSGPRALLRLRRRYELEADLAMHKWHRGIRRPERAVSETTIDALRAEIERLRGEDGADA